MASQTLSILSLASTLFYIGTGILGIGLLIGFHELGHFFFAKVFGVDTPSFSLGFGPALFEKKIGGTLFKVSAIPFGGYVEMAGAAEVGQGEQKEALRRDQGSFAVKPYYQKLLILLGGILFNLLFAYVGFTLLFAFGLPKAIPVPPFNTTTQIQSIEAGSPAQEAGLLPGDLITSINNEPTLNNLEHLLSVIHASAGQKITLDITREGKELSIPVIVASAPSSSQGRIGLKAFAGRETAALGLFDSLKTGIWATNNLIKATIVGLMSLFKTKGEGAGGPLMIISQITKGAQQGFKVWLFLLVIISVNLAVINLIPLPIVDGGQIAFYTIEAATGRPLAENIRMAIHYACWVLVILLFVFLTFKDLRSLFAGT